MYKEGLYLYHTWKTSNISNIFIKINLYLKKERENKTWIKEEGKENWEKEERDEAEWMMEERNDQIAFESNKLLAFESELFCWW